MCEEVSLIFRGLEVIHSLTPPDDFQPSKNRTTKKWKWVFTPPSRETQAGEYEVIIPTFPWGVGLKWLVHYIAAQTLQNLVVWNIGEQVCAD